MIAVLAVSLLAIETAAAAPRMHTVAAGESAASLAKKYYGEAGLGDLLLRYNRKPARVIHPGERLTIPFCEIYRARPGDTWSGLAKSRLGRATTSPALAELNGSDVRQPLRVGARVVIPVVLSHNLARGETLASLADRFYGDPKKASIVQTFSRIGDVKRLAVGTALEIPLVAFVGREPDPASKGAKQQVAVAAPPPEPPPPPPVEQRRFEDVIAAARRTYAVGEYDTTREALETLRELVIREGSVSDRREWGELLAFVYIALDREDDACTAYRSSSPPPGPASFDPDLISPRIREVLSSCRLDNPEAPPHIPPHAGTQG